MTGSDARCFWASSPLKLHVECFEVALQHSLRRTGYWRLHGSQNSACTPVHFYNNKWTLWFLTFWSVSRSKLQAPVLCTNCKFIQNVKPDVSQSEVMFYSDIRFGTIYSRIYCSKFMTLSNQTSPYISNCIRHFHVCLPFQWGSFLNIKNLLLQEQISSLKSGFPFLWASFMREADRKS